MAIDYTKHSYDDLVERITALLQDKPGWGDGYDSSTGQMLVQTLADVNDYLFYMLERRSQESFIDTAQLDSSIRARASELGYRPRRKVSATGTLQLDLVDEDENIINAQGNIIIPRNTVVTGVEHTYVTTDDRTIEVGESSITLPVKEGSPVTLQYNFDSEPYASDPTVVINDYIGIEEFSLRINDAEELFSDVGALENQDLNITSLSYSSSDDAVYDIKYASEGMRILFGDGEFGKMPNGNVNIEYIESSGSEIDMVSVGNEFTFESEFLEDDQVVSPPVVYRYSMVNATPIRGGQDEETSASIASNAPEYHRTGNRAVTDADHEFWILRSGIGNIIDVNVYGEQSTESLIYNLNNIQAVYATSDLLPLNVEQETALRQYIDRFKISTTHIAFSEAIHISLVLDVYIKKHQQLPIANEQLYTVVKKFIDDYLSINRNSIGGQFQHSEFVRYLQDKTFTYNSINYQVADFVKVDAVAQYPITTPSSVYDVLIYIDDSYGYVAGDTWTLVLDGTSVSVTVEAGDTRPVLVERMRQKIFDTTSFLTTLADQGETLRVKSPFVDEEFTLDLTQGDLSTVVTSDVIVNLPKSTLSNPTNQNLIKPGSVQVVDSAENVLFQDDGNGMMQQGTSANAPFVVDYTSATLLSPTMDAGDYFIRFQQNDFENFEAADNTMVVLSPFANTINDTPKFSKINIVT